MKLFLRCIKPITFVGAGGEICVKCEEGKSYRALLMSDGIRFSNDGKSYGLPYDIWKLEDYFITDFDEESYNNIYQKVKDFKLYFDVELAFEAP